VKHIVFSFSILTAIFPGEPGLDGTRMSPFWILLVLKLMMVLVSTGAMTSNAPVKSSPTNQHLSFYGCPSCPPTNTVRVLKGR